MVLLLIPAHRALTTSSTVSSIRQQASQQETRMDGQCPVAANAVVAMAAGISRVIIGRAIRLVIRK